MSEIKQLPSFEDAALLFLRTRCHINPSFAHGYWAGLICGGQSVSPKDWIVAIYEKEGGPRIEKSSGNKDLDKAALKIVRNSAPYGHFPQNMRSRDKDDVWVVITHFRFTRDQQLETELRGGVK